MDHVTRKKTILLVEDEVIIAMTEQQKLTTFGYDVIVRHNGDQAVETAVAGEAIDLILMDIDLGKGTSGPEAAQRILAHRHIPIVFLTSHAERDMVERVRGITRYGYIIKNSGDFVLQSSIEMAFELFDANRNLRESEERYRTIFENTGTSMFVIEEDTTISMVNSEFVRRSGYSREEIEGNMHWAMLVHPDDLDRMMEQHRLRRESGGAALPGYEFRYRTRSGEYRHALIAVELVPGTKKSIASIIDITDRKRAEEELILKSLVLDQVEDHVTITDLNGNIIYANKKQADILNSSTKELVGKSTIIYGEDPERGPSQKEIIDKTLRDGRWRGEIVNFAADGSKHIMALRTQAVHDAKGNIIALSGSATDITEQKRTENALRENEYRNRMIFEHINQGIFLSTLDGTFLQANTAIAEMAGYDSIDEFLRVKEVSLYADHGDRDRLVRELREKGSVRDREIRSVKKNGTVYWISLNADITKDEQGEPRGIIGFAKDITEQREANLLIEAERNLGLALAGVTSLDEAMRISLVTALAVADMDSGGVYLMNEAGGLDLVVHQGLTDGFLNITSHFKPNTASAQVVLRGDPVFVDDPDDPDRTNHEAETIALRAMMKLEGLKTLAVLPVRMLGMPQACMNVASHTQGTITAQKRMALESIALRMGSTILRIKTQESLLERERRFRSYFEMPLVGVAITSPAKGWIEVNDRTCELLGYSASELAGRTWSELTHPDDLAADLAQFNRVMSREIDSYSMDKRFIRKDGSVLWTSLGVGCVRNADNSVNYFVAILNDITERKRAEEDLRESEEKFRLLSENANDCIYKMKIPDGTYEYVSPSSIHVIGYSPEDLYSTPMFVRKIIHPDWQSYLETQWKDILDGKDPESFEYQIIDPAGRVRWLHQTNSFLKNREGRITSLLAIIRNITERKQTEEQVKALLAEKEVLLKEVHHRIKNNMLAMMSLLTLQANAMDDSAGIKALQDARSRMQSMALLYDKLYCSENVKELSINNYLPYLVDEIAAAYSGGAPIAIEKKIDDFSLSAKVMSTVGLITNELIINALKYAFPSRKAGAIIVSAAKQGNRVTLTFGDNGVGIPESVDFDHSPGFGLTLVGILTKQLGGIITMERNGGTRITLEFDA